MATAAKVTLTLSPQDFDVLRRALQTAFEKAKQNGDNADRQPELRRGDRAEALRIADVLEGLQ